MRGALPRSHSQRAASWLALVPLLSECSCVQGLALAFPLRHHLGEFTKSIFESARATWATAAQTPAELACCLLPTGSL